MKLIFLWGPPAAGKYTIGSKLSQLTGAPLFHNHLVIDALLEKLEWASDDFIALREAMWMAGFERSAKEGRSLIFTFQPEGTVEPGFPERVVRLVAESGGEVKFVRLVVSREEREMRLVNDSRSQYRKLQSVEILGDYEAEFAACEAAMPPAHLTIDTNAMDPNAAARRIAEAFDMPAASAAPDVI